MIGYIHIISRDLIQYLIYTIYYVIIHHNNLLLEKRNFYLFCIKTN